MKKVQYFCERCGKHLSQKSYDEDVPEARYILKISMSYDNDRPFGRSTDDTFDVDGPPKELYYCKKHMEEVIDEYNEFIKKCMAPKKS